MSGKKCGSMWGCIYDNNYDKYNWFHIGGDDELISLSKTSDCTPQK